VRASFNIKGTGKKKDISGQGVRNYYLKQVPTGRPHYNNAMPLNKSLLFSTPRKKKRPVSKKKLSSEMKAFSNQIHSLVK
jgi:hypothetical protein